MAKLNDFRVALLTALALVLVYLVASQSAPLRRLEGHLLDLRFQLRAAEPVSPPIALVLIDDASIATLGRWPWSRSRLGELVDALSDAGARVIALDLLLAEPEDAAPAEPWLGELDAALRALGGPDDAAGLQRLREVLVRQAAGAGGDLRLAEAMQRAGNVVVPFSFAFGAPGQAAGSAPPPDVLAGAAYRTYRQRGPGEPSVPLVASAALPPVPAIGAAATGLGHANIALDRDGTARFEYPVIAYAGDYYPSFPIEVARVHLGLERGDVWVEFGEGVHLGGRFVPTDEGMRLLVNYRRPGRYPTFSAGDVLAGDVPAAAFEDRTVLVGGAAAGIGESFVTPYAAVLPGAARHAAVVESILAGDFLVRRNATAFVDLGTMVAAGVVLGALAARSGILGTSLGLIVLLIAVAAGNVLAFTQGRLWLNLVFPLLTLVAVYAAVTLHKYMVGQRQERMIRRAFAHYLHPAVVEEICRSPELLRLGGEERELTVLFADVRDSTTIGERLPAADLVRLMNAYFTAMTRVIVDARGMLDQYVGDGLMAVFGAPLPLEDHAYRACEAALAMERELCELNRRLAREGLPEIAMGIGINTGRMVLGNLGSELRFNYTVLGDGVNLAARLETANKDYGTRILVSEATWRQAGDRVAARELDVVRVKGKEQPVRVFEVLGHPPLPEAEQRVVDDFAAALATYRDGRWREALGAFERVLDHAPDDHPSRLYARRCRERLAAERRAG